VAEVVYMTATDWASCSFVLGNIYKWDSGDPLDDPYCGFWVPSGFKTWDRLDGSCANYTLNTEGCCGGDCIPDETCCGFEQCWDFYETNTRSLATITGFSGGGGSTTGWSVSVTSVAASAGSWVSVFIYEFDITVNVEISWANLGTLRCDNDTTGTSYGSFTFKIQHQYDGLTCLDTDIVSFSETDPDCGIRVCEGTTQGVTNTTDCSRFIPSFDLASWTPPATPDLGNDCLTPSPYTIDIPIEYTLSPGDQGICFDCDSDGRWSGAAFPDLYVSTTLTLTGTWAI